jgi:hypothetical protein
MGQEEDEPVQFSAMSHAPIALRQIVDFGEKKPAVQQAPEVQLLAVGRVGIAEGITVVGNALDGLFVG